MKPYPIRIKYGGAYTDATDRAAIDKVLDSNWWTIGKEGQLLEQELASFAGTKYATLTSSGSNALMVAYAALGLPEGSEVITGSVHFPTTISSLYYNRLRPVFIDVNEFNYNFDTTKVKDAVRGNTKALVAVAVGGLVPHIDQILEIAAKYNLITILDNCIAEGTLIKTNKGDVAIENIKVGDMVLTRNGYKRVTKTWNKGYQKVITRFGVTATPDHKFITKNGEKELQNLNPSDILFVWNERSSDIEERTTLDIPMQSKDTEESTSIMEKSSIIDSFGKTVLGKFLEDILFTTKTIIHLITNYQIYSVLLQNNTLAYTSQKRGDLISQRGTSLKQEMERLNGINRKQDKNFMQSIISGFGLLGRNLQKGVSLVKENTQHTIPTNQNIVAQNVKRVFDLSVSGEHEFFANNILVHNCDGFGGTWKGKPLEYYFDISVTSFHAAHILCMGEGGAVFTNNSEYAKRMASIREWGRLGGYDGIDDKTKLEGIPDDYPARYLFDYMGFNMKPLELQCALGRTQLRKLPDIKAKRTANYQRLFNLLLPLHNSKLRLPTSFNGADPSFFCLPFLASRRGELRDYLENLNIETRTIFGGNITRQPGFRNFGRIVGSLDMADVVMSDGMFVSVHPDLTEEMVDFIGQAIKEFYAGTV